VAQEALALRDAGLDVTVLCPVGAAPEDAPLEVWEGITIHRYRLTAAQGGIAAYAREYGSAARSVARGVRTLSADRPFAVIHVANPPDLMFAAARVGAARTGARLIFDHHDLFPELLELRYGRSGSLGRLARWIERYALRRADVVVVPNTSYRQIALDRGRRAPEDVFVVRNAPDSARFQRVDPDPGLRRGREHLVTYLGVMGPQDGIDHALHALARLSDREDWQAVFMGDGMVRPAMEALAVELGLRDRVDFTGHVGDETIIRVLSTADVGLAPDPSNPFNDQSTMNKILEYMALGVPTVAYDLPEARLSAGDAALYASAGTPESLADSISTLLDDPARRTEMGRVGRERMADELSWNRSREALYAAYCRALQLD
jgi:glycosyltransferase involved in cell wall biosynthesis